MKSQSFVRLRRAVWLLALVVAAGVLPTATTATAAAPAPVDGELKQYDISGVYSAGISSGGYMATQLHVAYSGTFKGSGVFASGPYYCAQNDLNKALNACMEVSQDLQLDKLEQTTREWSAQGLIDPVSNLSGDPVYAFGGSSDSTVERPVIDALNTYYGRFGTSMLYNKNSATSSAPSPRRAARPAAP